MADQLIKRAGESLANTLIESMARANEQRGLCACGAPGDGTRCWWPVTGYALRKSHDIRHGDYIRLKPFDSPYWNDVRFRVETIQAAMWGCLNLSIKLFRVVDGKIVTQLIERSLLEREDVVIRATWPCNAPVCDLHGRDPGEGRRVCQAHAKSWEKVS